MTGRRGRRPRRQAQELAPSTEASTVGKRQTTAAAKQNKFPADAAAAATTQTPTKGEQREIEIKREKELSYSVSGHRQQQLDHQWHR